MLPSEWLPQLHDVRRGGSGHEHRDDLRSTGSSYFAGIMVFFVRSVLFSFFVVLVPDMN